VTSLFGIGASAVLKRIGCLGRNDLSDLMMVDVGNIGFLGKVGGLSPKSVKTSDFSLGRFDFGS